jgi:hypothetical protein
MFGDRKVRLGGATKAPLSRDEILQKSREQRNNRQTLLNQQKAATLIQSWVRTRLVHRNLLPQLCKLWDSNIATIAKINAPPTDKLEEIAAHLNALLYPLPTSLSKQNCSRLALLSRMAPNQLATRPKLVLRLAAVAAGQFSHATPQAQAQALSSLASILTESQPLEAMLSDEENLDLFLCCFESRGSKVLEVLKIALFCHWMSTNVLLNRIFGAFPNWVKSVGSSIVTSVICENKMAEEVAHQYTSAEDTTGVLTSNYSQILRQIILSEPYVYKTFIVSLFFSAHGITGDICSCNQFMQLQNSLNNAVFYTKRMGERNPCINRIFWVFKLQRLSKANRHEFSFKNF